jgi:hypothetical protein
MLFIIKNYERTRERLGSFIDLNVEIVKSSLPEQNSPIFFFFLSFLIFLGAKWVKHLIDTASCITANVRLFFGN